MDLEKLFVGIVTVALCGLTASPQIVRGAADGAGATALILEKQEGERRVHRSAGTTIGTAPFILKFDRLNGNTKHLVMFTEELTPSGAIPRHKHPGCEEILVLQTGRTRVHLGETVKEVGASATVFIPQDTWISAEVIGSERVSLIAILRNRIRRVHACDLGPRGRAQRSNVKTGIGCGPRAASSRRGLQVKPETQRLPMTNLRETAGQVESPLIPRTWSAR